jgi:hypothetical protein
MKKIILFLLICFFKFSSNAQVLDTSTPDSVYNFDFMIPWWDESFGNDYVPGIQAIDQTYIYTEVCSNATSDTLFFGNFNFNISNLDSVELLLKITKYRNGSEIKDGYLAVTYNGNVISSNLVDANSIWPESDSTISYSISKSELSITIDTSIINSSSFGFLFSTTPSDPYCMNAYIDGVELNLIKQSPNTSIATIESLQNVTLYPNPSSDRIFLNLEVFETSNMFIINSTGQIVNQSSIEQGKNAEINIEFLSPGVYTLVLSSKNTIKSLKFIKQ